MFRFECKHLSHFLAVVLISLLYHAAYSISSKESLVNSISAIILHSSAPSLFRSILSKKYHRLTDRC